MNQVFVVIRRPSGAIEAHIDPGLAQAVERLASSLKDGAMVGVTRASSTLATSLALAARAGIALSDAESLGPEDQALLADRGLGVTPVGLQVLPWMGGPLALVAVATTAAPLFPRPASLSAPRCNIPPSDTIFVGRQGDIDALESAWYDRAPLRAVVGPPGVGKSALGRRFARMLWDAPSQHRPPDAVWCVDLGECRQADEVLVAIAGVVGVTPGGTAPSASDVGHMLATEGEVLLVLDNVDPVGPLVARLAKQWRRDATRTTILVTTRDAAPWDIARQQVVSALPPEDALTLFYARSALTLPVGSTTTARGAIGRLVGQLGGNPLAIGLTARRASDTLLTPGELADRMAARGSMVEAASAEVPSTEHHRSLEIAIAWSWEQLDDEARALMTTLAMFPAGLSSEGLEALLQRKGQTLASVEALATRNLVMWEPSRLAAVGVTPRRRRLRVYPLVTQFVRRRAPLETTALGDHLDWLEQSRARSVAEWAEEWENLTTGGASGAVLRRAARALPWSAAVEAGVSPVAELQTNCDLDTAVQAGDLVAQVTALLALAHKGSTEQARQRLAEALAIARFLERDGLLHRALFECAMLDAAEGELERARDTLETLLQTGDDALPGVGVALLATVCAATGDVGAARQHWAKTSPGTADVDVIVEGALALFEGLGAREEVRGLAPQARQLRRACRALRAKAERPADALAAHLLLMRMDDLVALMDITANQELAEVAFSLDGRWLRLMDGREVDLSARERPARLLARLLAELLESPGRPIGSDALAESVWPEGAGVSPDVLKNRLYVTIRQLRTAGLGSLLKSNRSGYWLSTEVVWLRRE